MPWSDLTCTRIDTDDESVALFRLDGVFTNSAPAYGFLEAVRKAVADGARHLVVDLEAVPHLTSGGIGLLCAAFMSLHNAGGRMSLVALSPKHHTLLEVVGLVNRIALKDTREAALRE